MIQTMYSVFNGSVATLHLPAPNELVLRNIRWGAFDDLLSAAYWKGQAWQHAALKTYSQFRLGRSFKEEIAACLLGGYGIPAELGLAAFTRLRDQGLLTGMASTLDIEASLSEPFDLGSRTRRYRFARQKSQYLQSALHVFRQEHLPTDDLELRKLLLTIRGIGPKTASWIVRNYRASNSVAIIDVHILRAGRLLGLFPQSWEPTRDYFRLEDEFLAFANAIDVDPALLDALMWDYMRSLNASGWFRARRTASTIEALPMQFSLAAN